MRELEFRAWDKGKMRYDVWPTSSGTIGSWMDTGRELRFHDHGGSKVILMQYTGLKDKNGVKVFEGDVVEYTHEYVQEDLVDIRLAPIVFKDGMFTICHCPVSHWGEIEIKGNIHQHPNLLEKK